MKGKTIIFIFSVLFLLLLDPGWETSSDFGIRDKHPLIRKLLTYLRNCHLLVKCWAFNVWFGVPGDGRKLRAGAAAEGRSPGPGSQAGTRAQDLPPYQAVADQTGLRLLGVENWKNSGAARIDIQRFPKERGLLVKKCLMGSLHV